MVKYAAAVHAVDRDALACALARAMAAESERTGRAPVDCFIRSAWTTTPGRTAAAQPPTRSPHWPNSWPALPD